MRDYREMLPAIDAIIALQRNRRLRKAVSMLSSLYDG